MSPITVIDTIAPKNSGDFSVAEDTYLKGGWRVADDLTARNAIPTLRRKAGMRCYVISETKTYALVGGIANVNWEEVTDGGSMTDIQVLNALRTREALVFAVDYATGTSPDPDVLVHTQDEVDALGTLKYCQDVLNVLPPYRDFNIDVAVAAGDQYAPNDNYNSFMVLQPLTNSTKAPINEETGGGLQMITFQGARDTIYAGIAGTTSADAANRRYKFTRSAGTWTVDELKGMFIAINSGVGNGECVPCMGNSTTEAYFIGGIPLGACAVDILDPTTNLICDTDGGDDVYQGIQSYDYDGSTSPVIFEFFNVGSSGIHWLGDNITKGYVNYNYCRFTGQTANIYFGDPEGLYMVKHCTITLDGDDYNALYSFGIGPLASVQDTLLYGAPSDEFLYFSRNAKASYFKDVRIMPDAGYTGACIYLGQNADILYMAGRVDVFGGSASAIALSIVATKGMLHGCGAFCFNNVATATSLLTSEMAFDAAFAAPVSGTNGIGWKLRASTIRAFNPSTVAATTAVSMYATGTPETFAYTALAAIGDQVISSVGESLHRIG